MYSLLLERYILLGFHTSFRSIFLSFSSPLIHIFLIFCTIMFAPMPPQYTPAFQRPCDSSNGIVFSQRLAAKVPVTQRQFVPQHFVPLRLRISTATTIKYDDRHSPSKRPLLAVLAPVLIIPAPSPGIRSCTASPRCMISFLPFLASGILSP